MPMTRGNEFRGAKGHFNDATISRNDGHVRVSIRSSMLAVIFCSLSSGPCGLV